MEKQIVLALLGLLCLSHVVLAFNASIVDPDANITPTDLYNRTADTYVSMVAESKEEIAESTSGIIGVYLAVLVIVFAVVLVKVVFQR